MLARPAMVDPLPGRNQHLTQRTGDRRDLRGPDLERIVLDPSRLRKVLSELALSLSEDAALMVEEQ